MNARYTLIVGSKNWSSWSLRPWLAMKMAGLAFEEVLIPLRRPETKTDIKRYSPSGKVPTLIIAEGATSTAVWDSLAICEALADRHPDRNLWPSDARARAEARSVAAEMHSGFPELRKALPMEIAARRPAPELDESVEAEIARIVALWTSALDRHGANGGFLFGQFSTADAFYAPVVTRFETYGIALPSMARAYADRMLALTPMREWAAAAEKEAQALAR